MTALPFFALIAAILSPVFSSLSWFSEQAALAALHPVTVAATGPLISGILIWLYLLAKRETPQLEAICSHRKDLVIRTGCAMVFSGVCVAYSLTFTSSSKVIFLTKVEPYLILFWEWLFLGKLLSRYHLGLLSIHLAGAILLSTGGTFAFGTGQIGDILLLLGIVGHSLTYSASKRLAHALGSAQATALTQLFGGAILLPFALFLAPHNFALSEVTLPCWGYVAISVLFYYILSTVLWFYALKEFASWVLSALRCLGPVIVAPVAWIFFDQTLDAVQIIGASLVISTSLLLVRARVT